MSDDARRIREVLADPHHVAELLGLLDGAQLQRDGGKLVLCPAHSENSPSCSLTLGPDGTLRVRCFGCGLAGDVFSLVAATMGVDPRLGFRVAFLRAAKLAGIDVTGAHRGGSTGSLPRRESPPRLYLAHDRDAEERRRVFHEAAAEVLRGFDLIADHPGNRVREYLSARGLLEHAQGDGWGALPGRAGGRLWRFHAELVTCGIVRADMKLAYAEHRLVIPWRDRAGRITAIQRRRLDNAGNAPRYTQAGHVLVPYGSERLDGADPNAPIVIVEGAIDVLAARALARGPVVVLGLAGVASWRPAWAELARGRRVLVATDADAPGEACASRITTDVTGIAASVERCRPSDGAKDWAELLARRSVSEAPTQQARRA